MKTLYKLYLTFVNLIKNFQFFVNNTNENRDIRQAKADKKSYILSNNRDINQTKIDNRKTKILKNNFLNNLKENKNWNLFWENKQQTNSNKKGYTLAKNRNNNICNNFWKNCILKSPNKQKFSFGFSFVELVTVVGIIAVLVAIAIPMYSRYQTRALQGRMQHELAEIKKSLAYAHSVDGGYHQRIYTAGYKPDQELIAEVGFKYSRADNPCCNLFPNFNSSGDFSSFFTIKDVIFLNANLLSQLESATRASHICDAGKCTINTEYVTSDIKNISLSSIPSGAGSGNCGSGFASSPGFGSCGCEKYRIYAISKWRGSKMHLYANEEGLFCSKTGSSAGEKF